MSMLRPMRDELFKYRRGKRRSIDGSVPGVPHAHYRRSRRYVSGLYHSRSQAGFHDNLYNWGTPREYHPRLNAPAVQADEYEPFDEQGLQRITSNDAHLFRRLPDNVRPMDDPIPTYEDTVRVSNFFLKGMELMYQAQRRGQGPPSLDEISKGHLDSNSDMESDSSLEIPNTHELPSLEEVTDALSQLREVLPEDHPDIVHLETAAQILDYQESMPLSENLGGNLDPIGLELDSAPQEFDPYQEAEQIFNQQMQSFEIIFEEPVFEPVEPQAPEMFEEGSGMMFEQQSEEAFMEAESLEQIAEQEDLFEAPAPEFVEQDMMPEPADYDADVAADEINQAIDELSEQPMPQEMEPDPYMMGQNMFDEMQYMANPFMMPGPMGPMPGQMPGP